MECGATTAKIYIETAMLHQLPVRPLRRQSSHRQPPFAPRSAMSKRSLVTALAPAKKAAPEKQVDEKEKAINRSLTISSLGLGAAIINPLTAIPLGAAASASTLYIITPIVKEIGQKFLKNGETDARLLPVLGTVGVLASGYIVIGTASYTLFCVGEKLIAKTEDRSRQSLINIMGEQPKTVWLVRDEVEIETPFQQLRVDDVIMVSAGQMIPIDGEIVRGNATVDQQQLTGEAQPVEKGIGDEVLAATVVLSGHLHIRVGQTGDQTVAAQIGRILEQTVDYRTNSLLRFQKISNRLTVPALATAGLASLTMGAASGAALLFCLPIGMIGVASALNVLGHLNKASQLGVLVKDGRALEMLQEVDTIVFDKTGTLTLEQPTVGEIVTANRFDAETVLRYAASAETKQSHPIAQAILAAAKEKQLDLFNLRQTEVKIGYGLDVRANRRRIRVGSLRYMVQQQVNIPPHIAAHQVACDKQGISLVYIAIDDQLGGAIELHATIRPEAPDVIAALKEAGLQIAIISGDREQPTAALAAQLGIDSYFAEVLPQDKSNLIEQLQEQGRNVCFVGDGINDTIALKQANASISLAGATSAATDTAQMVLMDGTLSRLPDLIELSNQFHQNTNNTVKNALIAPAASIFGVFFLQTGIVVATLAYNVGSASGLATALSSLRKNDTAP